MAATILVVSAAALDNFHSIYHTNMQLLLCTQDVVVQGPLLQTAAAAFLTAVDT